MLPRENTSLLDAQTTRDHPQTHPYTRDTISQSPRFFLLIVIRDPHFACKRVAKATSARPWRGANARTAAGRAPHARRMTSAHRRAEMPPPARSHAAPELEICVQTALKGRSGEGLEGGWATNSRAGGGCAPSERPQTGRPDPSRCRLGKPTPREAGYTKSRRHLPLGEAATGSVTRACWDRPTCQAAA